MAINEIVCGKTRELRQSIIDKKDVSVRINRQHTLVHTLHEYPIRLIGAGEGDDLGIRPFHHHKGVNISMMDRMNYLLSVLGFYRLNFTLYNLCHGSCLLIWSNIEADQHFFYVG